MAVTIKQMQMLQRLKVEADNTRAMFKQTWTSIAQSIDPSELRMLEPAKPGEAAMHDFCKMYDTTALSSSRLFGDGLQAYACGSGQSWFRIKPEDSKYYQTDRQKEYFQKCERHMMAQLQKSNFYSQISPFFERGVNFATTVMLRMESLPDQCPMYVLQPLGMCSLMSNRYGQVDTLFRDFWLPICEAIDEYGIDNLPTVETNLWEENPTKLVKFSQYIGPITKAKLDIEGDGAYYNVIWCDSDITKAVRQEVLESKPFFTWRYLNDPNGTPYGIKSPGWIYAATSRQLQSQLRSNLQISQLMADPPIKRTRGLEVNFTPRGFTDVGPGEDFAPIYGQGDISPLLDSISRFQEEIKSGYYVDFFLALMSHVEQTKTASEAYLMQDEKAAIMSTFFAKLASDFIEPLLEDLWRSEIEYGRMPAPPESLQGLTLKIDFVSPLASQQKRVHALGTTRQFISEQLQIAQIAPSVLDVINFDQNARISGEFYEVDQRVLNSEETVLQTRQARMQQQMQQQQMENQLAGAEAMADIYQKTGKAPEKGSAMEQMAQSQGGNA